VTPSHSRENNADYYVTREITKDDEYRARIRIIEIKKFLEYNNRYSRLFLASFL